MKTCSETQRQGWGFASTSGTKDSRQPPEAGVMPPELGRTEPLTAPDFRLQPLERQTGMLVFSGAPRLGAVC